MAEVWSDSAWNLCSGHLLSRRTSKNINTPFKKIVLPFIKMYAGETGQMNESQPTIAANCEVSPISWMAITTNVCQRNRMHLSLHCLFICQLKGQVCETLHICGAVWRGNTYSLSLYVLLPSLFYSTFRYTETSYSATLWNLDISSEIILHPTFILQKTIPAFSVLIRTCDCGSSLLMWILDIKTLCASSQLDTVLLCKANPGANFSTKEKAHHQMVLALNIFFKLYQWGKCFE